VLGAASAVLLGVLIILARQIMIRHDQGAATIATPQTPVTSAPP
jgi:hypothetical protein